jgi:hypothetical protein
MDLIPPEDVINIKEAMQNNIDFLAVPCIDSRDDIDYVR